MIPICSSANALPPPERLWSDGRHGPVDTPSSHLTEAGVFYQQVQDEIEALRSRLDQQLQAMVHSSAQEFAELSTHLQSLRQEDGTPVGPVLLAAPAPTPPRPATIPEGRRLSAPTHVMINAVPRPEEVYSPLTVDGVEDMVHHYQQQPATSRPHQQQKPIGQTENHRRMQLLSLGNKVRNKIALAAASATSGRRAAAPAAPATATTTTRTGPPPNLLMSNSNVTAPVTNLTRHATARKIHNLLHERPTQHQETVPTSSRPGLKKEPFRQEEKKPDHHDVVIAMANHVPKNPLQSSTETNKLKPPERSFPPNHSRTSPSAVLGPDDETPSALRKGPPPVAADVCKDDPMAERRRNRKFFPEDSEDEEDSEDGDHHHGTPYDPIQLDDENEHDELNPAPREPLQTDHQFKAWERGETQAIRDEDDGDEEEDMALLSVEDESVAELRNRSTSRVRDTDHPWKSALPSPNSHRSVMHFDPMAERRQVKRHAYEPTIMEQAMSPRRDAPAFGRRDSHSERPDAPDDGHSVQNKKYVDKAISADFRSDLKAQPTPESPHVDKTTRRAERKENEIQKERQTGRQQHSSVDITPNRMPRPNTRSPSDRGSERRAARDPSANGDFADIVSNPKRSSRDPSVFEESVELLAQSCDYLTGGLLEIGSEGSSSASSQAKSARSGEVHTRIIDQKEKELSDPSKQLLPLDDIGSRTSMSGHEQVLPAAKSSDVGSTTRKAMKSEQPTERAAVSAVEDYEVSNVVSIDKVADKIITDHYGDTGRYTGVLLRGKPHGRGSMIYADGRKYVGQWKNGRWHGQVSKLTFPNGDCYQGDFDTDQRHGIGRYTWYDGRVYDGQFYRDQRQGAGTYTFPDGSVYTGGFVAGHREGQGCYKFADGSVYVGGFKEGKYHGVGECLWADGRCYRGEWFEGRAHGFGVEIRTDGTVRHDGQWVNDRPVRRGNSKEEKLLPYRKPKAEAQKTNIASISDEKQSKDGGNEPDIVAPRSDEKNNKDSGNEADIASAELAKYDLVKERLLDSSKVETLRAFASLEVESDFVPRPIADSIVKPSPERLMAPGLPSVRSKASSDRGEKEELVEAEKVKEEPQKAESGSQKVVREDGTSRSKAKAAPANKGKSTDRFHTVGSLSSLSMSSSSEDHLVKRPPPPKPNFTQKRADRKQGKHRILPMQLNQPGLVKKFSLDGTEQRHTVIREL